jgi:cell division protein FtsB
VANLLQIFSAQKQLRQQQREIEELRQELTKLRAQNDSMRQGMRRCVTCEYRIDFKQRQDESLDEEQNHVGTPSEH